MNETFSFFPSQTDTKIGLVSIPHAGLDIPGAFRPFLVTQNELLNRDVDFAVDQLIDIKWLNRHGVSVLRQNIHRVCVDVNRAREEAVFHWKKNSQSEVLVQKEVSSGDQEEFLKIFYDPFYQKLFEEKPDRHLDLHSMPSRATGYHLSKNPHQKTQRPEFCISNRLHSTSSQQEAESLFAQLKKTSLGTHILINDPYQGGEVIRSAHEGLKSCSIMLEINRASYMEEKSFELRAAELTRWQKELTQVIFNFLSLKAL